MKSVRKSNNVYKYLKKNQNFITKDQILYKIHVVILTSYNTCRQQVAIHIITRLIKYKNLNVCIVIT